jgi:cytochrome P450
MTLNPDVLKKAQEEIDRVIGSERLPTISDEAQLPYISALVKEVFRWGQVAPQGVPHALREDDLYKGYFIPKNSVIIPNIWYAISILTFFFSGALLSIRTPY